MYIYLEKRKNRNAWKYMSVYELLLRVTLRVKTNVVYNIKYCMQVY